MSNAEGPETRDEAASPEDATVPQEASEEAETEFHPFDDVTDTFGEPEAGRYVEGSDGMPAAVSQETESDVPALNPKSLVCMGDFSAFVLEIELGVVRFPPSAVTRTPSGAYAVPLEQAWPYLGVLLGEHEKRWPLLYPATPDARRPLIPAPMVPLHGHLRRLGRAGEKILVVEPLRKPCKHYVRQMTAFKFNAQHQSVARLCAARRTTEGTFMGLSDTGVYACDMRQPRDVESERLLDEFDARKIREGANREFHPMTATEAGGIFGPPQVSEKKE